MKKYAMLAITVMIICSANAVPVEQKYESIESVTTDKKKINLGDLPGKIITKRYGITRIPVNNEGIPIEGGKRIFEEKRDKTTYKLIKKNDHKRKKSTQDSTQDKKIEKLKKRKSSEKDFFVVGQDKYGNPTYNGISLPHFGSTVNPSKLLD